MRSSRTKREVRVGRHYVAGICIGVVDDERTGGQVIVGDGSPNLGQWELGFYGREWR